MNGNRYSALLQSQNKRENLHQDSNLKNSIKHSTFIVAVLIFYIVTGCSNHKDANKANFKAAINDYHDKNPVCIKVTSIQGKNLQIPYKTRGLLFSNKYKLDNFVAAGLLFYQKVAGTQTIKIYDFTDEGKSHFSESKNGFCYAKLSVKEILNFSEPTLEGHTSSTINYTAEVVDIANWAQSNKVQNIFPEIKQLVNRKKPLRTSTTLILTNNGWVNGDSFWNNQLN